MQILYKMVFHWFTDLMGLHKPSFGCHGNNLPFIRNTKSLNGTLTKKPQLKERSNQQKKFVQGDYNLINLCLFNLVTQFGNLLYILGFSVMFSDCQNFRLIAKS